MRQQVLLVCPAKGELIAGHLHPNTILFVGGQYADVGHSQMVVPVNGKRIGGHLAEHLFRLLTDQEQGIALHHEVEVLVVMMMGHW